jgi:hypothetical protein
LGVSAIEPHAVSPPCALVAALGSPRGERSGMIR